MLRINKTWNYTITSANTDEIFVITPIVIENGIINGIELDMRVHKGDDFGYYTNKTLKFNVEECQNLYEALSDLLDK